MQTHHVETDEIALRKYDPDMFQVNKIMGRSFPLSFHAMTSIS